MTIMNYYYYDYYYHDYYYYYHQVPAYGSDPYYFTYLYTQT